MDVTGNITTLIRLSYRFESYQYYKLSKLKTKSISILDLLKEKSVEEKENFLNSVRSKVSSKLKNTDNNKILDVISLVDAFSSSLSVTSLIEQSECVPKQSIVLPTEILGQGID